MHPFCPRIFLKKKFSKFALEEGVLGFHQKLGGGYGLCTEFLVGGTWYDCVRINILTILDFPVISNLDLLLVTKIFYTK